MPVVVIGLNHRTAPLELLERTTVAPDALAKALTDVCSRPNVNEAVVLSTCNRTEVYAVVERFHGAYQDIRDFLCDLAGRRARGPRRPPLQPVRRRRGAAPLRGRRPGSTRPCSASPRSSARSAPPGSGPAPRVRPEPGSTCCSATPSRSASGCAPRRPSAVRPPRSPTPLWPWPPTGSAPWRVAGCWWSGRATWARAWPWPSATPAWARCSWPTAPFGGPSRSPPGSTGWRWGSTRSTRRWSTPTCCSPRPAPARCCSSTTPSPG